MAIDSTTPRSRRPLLTAAVGGAAVAAAASGGGSRRPHRDRGGQHRLIEDKPGHVERRHHVLCHLPVGGIGVTGTSFSGTGVHGQVSSGIGVNAVSSTGLGLRVERGRIKVDEASGVATIKKGKKTVGVKPGLDINGRTFVLLTPMANIRVAWLTLERG